MTAKIQENTNEIHCEESMDISGAASLQARLSNALESASSVTLHADKVERSDTAALQVLVAFIRALRARGISISWKEPSVSLRGSAQLLGLAQELEMPSQD